MEAYHQPPNELSEAAALLEADRILRAGRDRKAMGELLVAGAHFPVGNESELADVSSRWQEDVLRATGNL
jgi:hypothetical protein